MLRKLFVRFKYYLTHSLYPFEIYFRRLACHKKCIADMSDSKRLSQKMQYFIHSQTESVVQSILSITIDYLEI